MPAYKNSPARLAIELNPTDGSESPTKKRGLVLMSSGELEEYWAIFQFDKLVPLLKSLDGVNLLPVKARYVFGHAVYALLLPPLLPSRGTHFSSVMTRYAVFPRNSFGQVTLAPLPYQVTSLFMNPKIPVILSSVATLNPTFLGIHT